MIYSRSFNPTLNPTYSAISQGWFYSGEYVLTSRPQLFESWIAQSVALISIQWICSREINFVIHWIEIYPVDSAIHLLNIWGLSSFVGSDIELFSKIMQMVKWGTNFGPLSCVTS